jgi:hypothetical protein
MINGRPNSIWFSDDIATLQWHIQEIIGAKDLEQQSDARWLASVYFKNSINRYWRTRRDSPWVLTERMGFCLPGFLNGVSAVYMIHSASPVFLLRITLAFRSNHAPSLGIGLSIWFVMMLGWMVTQFQLDFFSELLAWFGSYHTLQFYPHWEKAWHFMGLTGA